VDESNPPREALSCLVGVFATGASGHKSLYRLSVVEAVNFIEFGMLNIKGD
jgi:hypothetical protein